MTISTKGRYALRIMMDLAGHMGETVKLKDIAARQDISEKYMEQIYVQTEDLSVGYHKKVLLSDIALKVNKGEILVLIGPNGAGKSTLGNVIMGNSQYKVDRGSIFFEDEDITSARTDERAQKGLFLSFQIGRASCKERV